MKYTKKQKSPPKEWDRNPTLLHFKSPTSTQITQMYNKHSNFPSDLIVKLYYYAVGNGDIEQYLSDYTIDPDTTPIRSEENEEMEHLFIITSLTR